MYHFHNIVILTGAGISQESGIKTFRDHNGLWENHKIEEVATPEAFIQNPSLVHQFYNLRRAQLLSDEVAPNAAHKALVRLQKEFEGSVQIITQNVDDLHERAGAKNVLHMHGELLKAKCNHCHKTYPMISDLRAESYCPHCLTHGGVRPDIVWFGELPYHMDEINQHLKDCDLFIAIGTSGNVYPAAGFVQMCKQAIKIEVNIDDSMISNHFHHHYTGAASIEVPKLVDKILKEDRL